MVIWYCKRLVQTSYQITKFRPNGISCIWICISNTISIFICLNSINKNFIRFRSTFMFLFLRGRVISWFSGNHYRYGNMKCFLSFGDRNIQMIIVIKQRRVSPYNIETTLIGIMLCSGSLKMTKADKMFVWRLWYDNDKNSCYEFVAEISKYTFSIATFL